MVNAKLKQGSIIKLNLNPTKGHEQAGYCSVLVVNNASFSRASNMVIVCPITNTDRKKPLHVRLDGLITRFVMCDQVRVVDIQARDYKIIETVDDDVLWDVCDMLQGAIEIEK